MSAAGGDKSKRGVHGMFPAATSAFNRPNVYPAEPYNEGLGHATNAARSLRLASTGAAREITGQIFGLSKTQLTVNVNGTWTNAGVAVPPAGAVGAGTGMAPGSTIIQTPNAKQLLITGMWLGGTISPNIAAFQFLLNRNPVSDVIPIGYVTATNTLQAGIAGYDDWHGWAEFTPISPAGAASFANIATNLGSAGSINFGNQIWPVLNSMYTLDFDEVVFYNFSLSNTPNCSVWGLWAQGNARITPMMRGAS